MRNKNFTSCLLVALIVPPALVLLAALWPVLCAGTVIVFAGYVIIVALTNGLFTQ